MIVLKDVLAVRFPVAATIGHPTPKWGGLRSVAVGRSTDISREDEVRSCAGLSDRCGMVFGPLLDRPSGVLRWLRRCRKSVLFSVIFAASILNPYCWLTIVWLSAWDRESEQAGSSMLSIMLKLAPDVYQVLEPLATPSCAL